MFLLFPFVIFLFFFLFNVIVFSTIFNFFPFYFYSDKRQKGGGKGMSQGSKKGDGKDPAGQGKKGFEGKGFMCGTSGHMSEDCRFKETNAFEVDEEEPFSENGCLHMSSIELNALEIGSCACATRKVTRFALESTHVRQCGSVPEKKGGR